MGIRKRERGRETKKSCPGNKMKITKGRRKRGEEAEKKTRRNEGGGEGNRNQGPVKIIASERQEVESARRRELRVGADLPKIVGTAAGQFARRFAERRESKSERRGEIFAGSTPTWDN